MTCTRRIRSESGFRSHAADRYKLSIPAFEAQLDGLSE